MLKRLMTVFCVLALLLSCFPAVVAQAAASGEVEMAEPDMFGSASVPKDYNTPSQYRFSDDFVDYLIRSFASCPDKVNIKEYNLPYTTAMKEELKNLIWDETPELFHCYSLGFSYSNGKLTSINVTYRPYADTASEYKSCLAKMQEGAQYLLRGVKGNNALSQSEKALILHDRLVVWTEYNFDNIEESANYGAYGALGRQIAVCKGYAMAYMYLLEQVGVESDLCSSVQLNHAWNIVYIGGVPYHTDVTWDDNNYCNSYNDIFGAVSHKNFLRSTAGIKETGHNATDFVTTPTATNYDDKAWWWYNCKSSIEVIGSDIYYLDTNHRKVYRFDPNNVFTPVYSVTESYCRLDSVDNTLFVSREKSVVVINASTGQVINTYYPPIAQGAGCYIEGLKYEKGRLYVQVRNADGSSSRDYMKFADSSAVKITTQPKDVVAPKGTKIKVSVWATGDGLSYSWYHKDAGASSFVKASITGATYTTSMANMTNGRQVYCVVRDQYGHSVQSNTVTLKIGNLATITTQPKNVAAPKGEKVKVSVWATGDGLSYTWYHKDYGAASFVKASITGATYTTKMANMTDRRQVYCVVTDQYGNSVRSNTVTLYVGNPATITTQPKSVSGLRGTKVKVSVWATGDGLSYSWYHKDAGASSFVKASITGATYTTSMANMTNGRKVYCVVKDKYGTSVTTNTVTLKMVEPAKIVTQPKSVTAPKGTKIYVTVKATGDGLKYTWYHKDVGASSFTKAAIPDENYTTKIAGMTNGRQIYCIVTDKYGTSVRSNTVTLTAGNPVKITTPLTGVTAAKGTQVKVSVWATGDGLSYTWYHRDAGASSFVKASITGATYTTKMANMTNGRQVYCVVKDKYGNAVTSNSVTLKMK